jgi:hypothetical protein
MGISEPIRYALIYLLPTTFALLFEALLDMC